MKNLFFTSALFSIFLGTSASAVAQKTSHAARPVKFIEGIEIKRDVYSQTSAVNNTKTSNKPAIVNTNPAIEKSLPVQFKYAQLLNRNVESVNNISLYKFIEDWWETRYQYGGSNKSGIDCSGFSGQLFSNVYTTSIPRTAREQYSACEKMEREKLAEGDLVFFNTSGGVSHVGVYLGEGYFVHASITSGVTINNLDDDYYGARFLGGGRISKVSTDGVVKVVGSR
ncbi:MAG: NlpC/P60 family protein [Ferruginibacter sp.]